MTVIPRSASVASCEAGATTWSTSPTASEPPAPASVALVLLAEVTVTVPSDVVEPELILLTANTALAVALVVSNTTVPARLGATVSAIAQGTLTTADAVGLPLKANATGTDCTALGIWAYETDAPA